MRTFFLWSCSFCPAHTVLPQRAHLVLWTHLSLVCPHSWIWILSLHGNLLASKHIPVKLIFLASQQHHHHHCSAGHSAKHCIGIISFNHLHNPVVIPTLKRSKRSNPKLRKIEVTRQKEEAKAGLKPTFFWLKHRHASSDKLYHCNFTRHPGDTSFSMYLSWWSFYWLLHATLASLIMLSLNLGHLCYIFHHWMELSVISFICLILSARLKIPLE